MSGKGEGSERGGGSTGDTSLIHKFNFFLNLLINSWVCNH